MIPKPPEDPFADMEGKIAADEENIREDEAEREGRDMGEEHDDGR